MDHFISGGPRSAGRIIVAILVAALLVTSAAAVFGAARPLAVPASGRTGFTSLPAEATGLRFANELPLERAATNHNLMNGSGVAAADYDGDGRCDLFFCNLNGQSVLFRNLGSWRFEAVTKASGISTAGQAATGAVFGDVNGDGWVDLIVTACGGPNVCWINDGRGHFTNALAAAGLASKWGSTSLAMADIEGDGDLDLYIANYGENTIRSGIRFSTRTVNGQETVIGRYANRLKIIDGKVVEFGEPDLLYRNDGHGHFTPVDWTDGTLVDEEGNRLRMAPWDMGLSVMFRDVNDDGAPDIYVCNDFHTPDRFWINRGNGTFQAARPSVLSSISNFSMAVDFADIDRDGHLDFFVADMLSRQHPLRMTQANGSDRLPARLLGTGVRPQVRRNTLFHNRGDGTFAEIANFSGVASSDWTWSSVFLDVDLDGYEDLLISNGNAFDTQDLDATAGTPAGAPDNDRTATLRRFPKLDTPNYAFRNQRDLTFQETGESWGFNSKQVSHGTALADLDNDGDLDVVINCLNAPALVYRNESNAPRIAVRLKGAAGNSGGVGSRITVTGNGVPTQSQEILGGGRYLSSDDTLRVFAAGNPTNDLQIQVRWRSGKVSELKHARPNFAYELDEAAAVVPATMTTSPAPEPWFVEVSERIKHDHEEADFDDFERQPLLPRRYSRLGPAVACVDLNHDQHDDLMVGASRGGTLKLFINNGRGEFTSALAPADLLKAGDLGGFAAGPPASPGLPGLLGVASHYEVPATPAALLSFQVAAPGRLSAQVVRELAEVKSDPGPIATGDLDGDGDLDLFIGGRVVPGRYPEPAISRLFRNENGNWTPDTNSAVFGRALGLVSGAVFADLMGDGLPELVLATEWGPVRVFRNTKGKLEEATADLHLNEWTGWWNGIAAGDFDEDGRLDLVASNWGLNNPYQDYSQPPPLLVYGDFDQSQSLDLIETESSFSSALVRFPRRDLNALSSGLPFLRGLFARHRDFATASLGQILAGKETRAQFLQVKTLATTVFLNRGAKFEPTPLPQETQFAPAFGIVVADADGDAHDDLFFSQNFFDTAGNMPRLEGGRGLWLRGDGQGKFAAVPGQISGVAIYGQQRGCAVADFNEDGRTDLVVAQNGAALKVYLNRAAKPGVRVRLAGPPQNPAGLGAIIRVKHGEHWGPARLVAGGSGYWSQDSLAPVMAAPPNNAEWEVKWHDGTVTRTNVVAAKGRVTLRK